MLGALLASLLVAGAWIASDAGEISAGARLDPLSSATGDDLAPGTELATLEPTPPVRTLLSEAPADPASAATTPAPATPLDPEPSWPSPRLSPAPVGQLVLRAVDASTGVALRARVRAASATRIAERFDLEGANETTLRLTPDDYALEVASAGYEPLELPPVRVLAGATTTPPSVRLQRGSGRIAGRADGARAAEGWRVELFGDGRLACGGCDARPCSRCGWAPERSVLPLDPGGAFAFERLASAVYVVRLVDERGCEAGTAATVELATAESARVALAIARPRAVRVAFDDVDGTPLDHVWAARIAGRGKGRAARAAGERARGAEELARSRAGGGAARGGSGAEAVIAPAGAPSDRDLGPGPWWRSIPWHCRVVLGDELVAEGSFHVPPPVGERILDPSSIGCGLIDMGERDDRPRGAYDALRPPPAVPRVEPSRIAVEVEPGGLVRFELSARAERLDVRCGPFTAAVGLGGVDEADRSVRLVRDQVSLDFDEPTWLAFEARFGR